MPSFHLTTQRIDPAALPTSAPPAADLQSPVAAAGPADTAADRVRREVVDVGGGGRCRPRPNGEVDCGAVVAVGPVTLVQFEDVE